jgi:Heterokaryon incompatibility protein (HET)
MIRLLQYENGGFSLIEFATHKLPEYAILSHTWGPDAEEVSFKDIVEKKDEGKAGYNKLKFCAEQAAGDGLRYFWIDTCCIDKSNGPEIGEAIRSMFRWYAGAARCYVYLSDVPNPKEPTSTVESAFANSRWFTRGWTLQELIASKSVEFFSNNRESLGSKTSRMQQIHEITGIAIEALQGLKPISRFSTADRMSWAARRETTREEDAAYCLLGLFEIHIPVMYGEGKQHAEDRLRRAIQEASTPTSVLLTDT